jgi:hypothetical protein
VAAYQRIVARCVQFNAVSTTVLGNAAGGFCRGERVVQRAPAEQFGDTEAGGDAAGKAVLRALDFLADVLAPMTCLVECMAEQNGDKTIAGKVRAMLPVVTSSSRSSRAVS